MIEALDAAEDWADGSLDRQKLSSVRRKAGWSDPKFHLGVRRDTAINIALYAANLATRPRRDVVSGAGWHALYASREFGLAPQSAKGWSDPHQAALLRDIFGNPFRPVAFDPAWRTADTIGIAARMYDSRDFAAMPILADALEEAGCTSPDVLLHAREPGVHVRGCWVVDGVLGKS